MPRPLQETAVAQLTSVGGGGRMMKEFAGCCALEMLDSIADETLYTMRCYLPLGLLISLKCELSF
jgi:hypothetical protein